ncbi:trehalose-phosphatase [Corynebacterium heidelbergense]|uniref:Trehalose 6-phosphate phosphatase n=1 Tax=Corynebacterium heidelbergense TaxID=2055947 RepID=A0A364V9W4_9CORY|nr:trehalose-phosphatase [Corynebacterium heidelbergense]RAV33411.1 trehalose-phosphatase [Corynebacterium heidelbergense]WCZ35924.1 Trehalose-phosphate phosphatase [Corynebacterium heidelbergense]
MSEHSEEHRPASTPLAPESAEPTGERQAAHQSCSPLTEADLAYLAQAGTLLLAVDFDGTLAPFVDDPAEARAIPGSLEALQQLATRPGTTVLVISGRNLAQLTAVTGLPAITEPTVGDIRLVGSHGAEPADEPMGNLSPERAQLLQDLTDRADALAAEDPGLWVEFKPLSVSLHSRTAEDAEVAARASAEYAEYAETQPLATTTRGKNVVEVAVDHATKGGYVERLREAMRCGATVFLGDDVTDETVMEILRQDRPDLGIHVTGEDPQAKDWTSAAARTVRDPHEVKEFLAELARRR